MKGVTFTHVYVKDFGWETTILLPEDFLEIELLGSNEIDGNIYLGIHNCGSKRILKGYKC